MHFPFQNNLKVLQTKVSVCGLIIICMIDSPFLNKQHANSVRGGARQAE